MIGGTSVESLKMLADFLLQRHLDRATDADQRNRRRAVFERLRAIRDQITTDLNPSIPMIGELHRLREDSVLLFGRGIPKYISDWIQHAVALHTAHECLKNPNLDRTDRQRRITEHVAATNFFARQYGELAAQFRRYLC